MTAVTSAANVTHTKDGPKLTMGKRRLPITILMSVLLVGFALLMIVPFIWMVSSSFTSKQTHPPMIRTSFTFGLSNPFSSRLVISVILRILSI